MTNKNKKIGFKDLSWSLRIAYIGGLTYAIIFGLGFIYGVLSA